MVDPRTTQPLRYRSDLTHKYSKETMDPQDDLQIGEFCYQPSYTGAKWVHFWPWDSPVALSASVAPQRNSGGSTWVLNGTEDAPTLSPSVDAVGFWHGFLTDGIATKCP